MSDLTDLKMLGGSTLDIEQSLVIDLAKGLIKYEFLTLHSKALHRNSG